MRHCRAGAPGCSSGSYVKLPIKDREWENVKLLIVRSSQVSSDFVIGRLNMGRKRAYSHIDKQIQTEKQITAESARYTNGRTDTKAKTDGDR